MQGYVFAWDIQNILDPSCGPDKLCLRSHPTHHSTSSTFTFHLASISSSISSFISPRRAHNAMDPEVYDKCKDKPVYGVHVEHAAMVQAGTPVLQTG